MLQSTVFDGVNTYSYATLAGSTYTLNEDLFTNDGATVEAGITLNTNSFKLYCNGTFTNNGTISNNGANASGATAGTHTYTSEHARHRPRGRQRTYGNGTGTSASPQGSTNTVADALISGGAGGAGGVEAGGAGGVYLAGTTNGGSHSLVSLETGYLFAQQAAGTGASLGIIGGGCGGGGGGSDNAGVNGGGGGGGGGVMVLCLFDFVNNGVVEALGGNGAAASGAGGNGGGGGGGAGGFINILARYRSGNGTVNACLSGSCTCSLPTMRCVTGPPHFAQNRHASPSVRGHPRRRFAARTDPVFPAVNSRRATFRYEPSARLPVCVSTRAPSALVHVEGSQFSALSKRPPGALVDVSSVALSFVVVRHENWPTRPIN